MLEESAAFLSPVATYVLVASFKGTVAIAVVLLCRKLFAARLSARARHGLWLAALASLLLPWGFGLPVDVQFTPPAMERPGADVDSRATHLGPDALLVPGQSTATPGVSIRLSLEEVPHRSIPIQSWMVLLWAAVVTVLAAIPALSLHRYRRIAAQATVVSGPAQELLLDCRTQTGLRRSVRLLESSAIASPALFGWLSPTLLLPPGLPEQLGATQLRHVLLHELAHVQRHDILVNWFATCAQILHWFNPVVWYGLRVMRSDMEQACDARVLRQLSPGEHDDYGRTLICVLDDFPGPVPAQALGVVESQAQLKERIVMISKFGSRRIGSPVLAAVLLLGLVSVAATQPQTGSKPQGIVIRNAAESSRQANTPILMAQAQTQASAPSQAPTQPQRQSSPRPQPQVQAQAQGQTPGPSQTDAAQPNTAATEPVPAAAPSQANVVDLNIIPSNLLKRMDVVTGGASATYGSGAMVGVVNLVLNNRLRGFQLQGFENFQGTRALRILALIVQVNGDTDEARIQRLSLFSEVGIYPKDPDALLASVRQVLEEYAAAQDRFSATLCARSRDVTTSDMLADVMRQQKLETDTWKTQRYWDFYTSLSPADRTPPAGVAASPPLRLEFTPEVQSFSPEQYNNFIKWRDAGCRGYESAEAGFRR